MTRLESRPARHTLWDYVFFVDIDGHHDEPKVAKALTGPEAAGGVPEGLGPTPLRFIDPLNFRGLSMSLPTRRCPTFVHFALSAG